MNAEVKKIDIPDSYYIGQEYVEDPNKVEVLIKYTIGLPVKMDKFIIDDELLHVRQKDSNLYVNIIQKISNKLLKDVTTPFDLFVVDEHLPKRLFNKNQYQCIVGYIRPTLARVNQEILRRKHSEGHPLLRTVSQFDIKEIFVVSPDKSYHAIPWPLPLPVFPPLRDYAESSGPIFIQDLLDAMTEYLYYNPDECIRKIITSLENYFYHYDLSNKKRPGWLNLFLGNQRKGGIRSLIKTYITDPHYGFADKYLQILRNNILFIYHLRCEVVHRKLRLDPNNMFICKKAIGTLCYIYQSDFVHKDKMYDYIFALNMQFGMIANIMTGVDLNDVEKSQKSKKGIKTIRNPDDMDKWMFSGLKISKSDKRKAKSLVRT